MARILIIENRPTNLDLLVTLLGYYDHTVFAAHDGAEGLVLTLTERPELVVADILMPEMDGYEFARRVRADPAIAQTRIMFYTAADMIAKVYRQSRDCGVAHVLAKPADPEEIIEVVNAALASAAPAAIPSPITTADEYLRLLTNTLHHKVAELKTETHARAQAETALRQQAERVRLLATLARILAEVTHDYQATLDTAARQLSSLIGDTCMICMVSSDGARVDAVATHHFNLEVAQWLRDTLAETHMRPDAGVIGRVIQTGQPLLQPVTSPEQLQALLHPAFSGYAERFGGWSLLVVPLRAHASQLGAVCLIRDQLDQAYTEDDLAFLQDLADRVALAITNARLFTQIQSKLAEQSGFEEAFHILNLELTQRVLERTLELTHANEALEQANAGLRLEATEHMRQQEQSQQNVARAQSQAELSQALIETGLEYQPLFDVLAQHTAELVRDAWMITLLSADGLWQETVAFGHTNSERGEQIRALLPTAPTRANAGIAGHVTRTGQPLRVPGVASKPARTPLKSKYLRQLERLGIASLLLVPLQAHSRILGTLGIARDWPAQPYSLHDQDQLNDIADRAAPAIENTRLMVEARAAYVAAGRANLSKSEFLTHMSHELRTPLNAIMGFTGTLLMRLPGPLTADQEKQLRTIQASARHLLSLINDLLNLAAIESGKIELDHEQIICQDVITDVVATLRPLFEQKGIVCTVVNPADPIIIQSDRRMLSQILINLVNNAIKFTDQGMVRIELADEQKQGRRRVKISVTDTGIGIRAEDQLNLFREFVRGDAAREQEGTGLGLHLSQQMAGLLGGDIAISSVFGQGSMFTLSLRE